MTLNPDSIRIQNLGHQSIVWFRASNTYVLLASDTAAIIKQLSEGLSKNALHAWCTNHLGLTAAQAVELWTAVNQLLEQVNEPKASLTDPIEVKAPANWYAQKYYQLGSRVMRVSYETELLEFMTHPKIAHLTVEKTTDVANHFEVFKHQNEIILKVDGKTRGHWKQDEIHFFQGKFSMALVEQCYQKEESEWMGVFHATAMSDGKHNLMFTGDSGSGKSTLAALLLDKGYTVWVDDFVPVSAGEPQVYYFPAAISIKEKAVPHLIHRFPQLEHASQYHFKSLGKKVRYLPTPSLPKEVSPYQECKGIVFVNYKDQSEHLFKKLDKCEAFQRFIPDSWIAPDPESAQQFLNWFTLMPCYELTYSDTEKMYKTVEQLFNDDL